MCRIKFFSAVPRKHGLNNNKAANAVISFPSKKDQQKDFAAM